MTTRDQCYIFLDIDGILVLYLNEFYPPAVNNLNELIEDTGAKIIISSGWRHAHSIEELQSIFNKNGIVGEIIGATSCTHEYSALSRNDEIKAYVDSFGIKNFVILEDTEKIVFTERIVKISGSEGFSRQYLWKARAWLLQ